MSTEDTYKRIKWAIIVGALIVVVPLFPYAYNFWGRQFSNDPEQWGQFSDYLNVFVSLASLVLLSVLSYVIHQNEVKAEARFKELEENAQAEKEEADRKEKAEKDAIEKHRNRPLIIFKVNPKTKKWVIKNVGNGAALNVKLSYIDSDNGWTVPVKIYSFQSGEDLELHFHISPWKLCAVYYDIHQNVISSIGEGDDTNFLFDKDELNMFKDHYIRLDEINSDPKKKVNWRAV